MIAVLLFIGETGAEAEDKRDLHDGLVDRRVGLSTLAARANADFGALQLDATVNEISDTGSQGRSPRASLYRGRRLDDYRGGRQDLW